MNKKDAGTRETPVEVHEREAPIAPIGNQINYSEMVLTQVRSAPTNMGWKSVAVTLVLALACAGVTSLYYILNVPSFDKLSFAIVRDHVEQGDKLYQAREYDAAIVEYNKAIVGKNDYDLAYYRRGEAYQAKGNNERAAADYRKVLEISGDATLKQDAQTKLQALQGTTP